MPQQRAPSGHGRSAVAVHALALLAGTTCVLLAIWADARDGNQQVRAGAVVAGSACGALWLWSALLGLRSLWHGEPLRWCVPVLTIWVLELLAARWRQSLLLRYIDADWLPVVQYVAPAVYVLVVCAVLLSAWRRVSSAEKTHARLSRTARLMPVMFVLAAAIVAFFVAPKPRVLVMSVDRICESAPAHATGLRIPSSNAA